MNAVPIRLLLLEDNPGDARLVQTTLADEAPGEFAITTAERLADALARIQTERFDAVLCDLGLPDSTGLGTAQAIVAGAPALPLVVLTGSHNEDLGRAAIALGAQDYLVKGETRAPTIARTLRYAIERKRLENELHEANETLERRVTERTAALTAANETLRADDEQIQRYIEQLRTAFMGTVEIATTLSEMRDPYTVGNERRVADIAAAIGTELGFGASRQEGLRVAGLLHDIGKIKIPAEILTKPGKLSPIQFQLIQGHAQTGYDVLKDVEFPWPVAEVARQHHERIDGSGYPQGLKGDAILLEARILAVADVLEAMSSHRPYRPGLGVEAALAEIERGSGIVYDATVAAACLKLFREKGYTIPS